MENKRVVGAEKEALAIEYMKAQGAVILDRNFYFRTGEIDIVAKDGEYLCFIEVKYRKSNSYGAPEAAVTPAKQKKIVQGAVYYMYKNHIPEDTPCRFDVISINKNDIIWLKDAFTADR